MKWLLEESFKIFGVLLLLVPVLKFLFMLTYAYDYVSEKLYGPYASDDLDKERDVEYKDNKTDRCLDHYDNLDW